MRKKFRAAHHIPRNKILSSEWSVLSVSPMKRSVVSLRHQDCVIDVEHLELVVHNSEIVTLITKGFYPGLASAASPSGIQKLIRTPILSQMYPHPFRSVVSAYN